MLILTRKNLRNILSMKEQNKYITLDEIKEDDVILFEDSIGLVNKIKELLNWKASE